MDARYQLASEPFAMGNANPDGQPLSREEVYAGWSSDALKYYWRDLNLTIQPFDPVWFDKRDDLAFGPRGGARSQGAFGSATDHRQG